MTRPARGFAKAITDLQRGLDRSAAPSMLIGGVAVIAHGVPRTTLDVDATIEASGLDLQLLLSGLSAVGIEPRIDEAVAFARTSQVLLLRHQPSRTPIDLSLAWLPFETEALRRSILITMGRSKVRVPHVEDLLLYKLVASRPKDLEDAQHLLSIHRTDVDIFQVRARLVEFCEVLEDTERLKHLDALLAHLP